MNVTILIVFGYVLGLFAISWYAKKYASKGGAVGFLLAGRNLPTILVATMIAAQAIGGAATVGVAEKAYTKGLSAGFYTVAWFAAALVFGVLLAGYMRKIKVTTIPEFFERYFDKKSRFIAVVAQLIIIATIIALQYIAGGAILTALLPDIFTFGTGMFATAVVFVGITLIGGFWAAGFSNLINVIVIYVGIILSVIATFSKYGGIDTIATKLPSGSHWFDPVSGIGMTGIIIWIVVMVTQNLSSQSVAQIAFAAKDEKAAKKGMIIGSFIILPIGFICAIFGITSAAMFPGLEKASMALPTLVMSLNPVIAALLLAGLWAADISTACGLLLACSQMVIKDVYQPFAKTSLTDKQEIVLSRVAVLFIAVVTFIMANQIRSILGAIMVGNSAATAFTLVMLAIIFFPKLCKKGTGFWTMLVGVVVMFLWVFVPSTHFMSHIIYQEWIACGIAFAIVYLIDKRPMEPKVETDTDNSIVG